MQRPGPLHEQSGGQGLALRVAGQTDQQVLTEPGQQRLVVGVAEEVIVAGVDLVHRALVEPAEIRPGCQVGRGRRRQRDRGAQLVGLADRGPAPAGHGVPHLVGGAAGDVEGGVPADHRDGVGRGGRLGAPAGTPGRRPRPPPGRAADRGSGPTTPRCRDADSPGAAYTPA